MNRRGKAERSGLAVAQVAAQIPSFYLARRWIRPSIDRRRVNGWRQGAETAVIDGPMHQDGLCGYRIDWLRLRRYAVEPIA